MVKKATSGVYVLCHEGTIVYVGESSNIFMRIGQHIAEGRKLFDSFTFYETADRKRLESFLINTMRPKYNIASGKYGYIVEDIMTEDDINFAIRAYEERNKFISVRYAAELIDEYPESILHLIQDKKIKAAKIAGKWLIEKTWVEKSDELKNLINQNESQRIQRNSKKGVILDG